MSLFQTLSIGATGLGANGTGLQVVGDNIANMGTTGFKSGRASFADIVPELAAGLGGMTAMGRGAMLAGIGVDRNQGALESTGMPLDVAVLGEGMFQVARGDQMFYTRDGHFQLDKDGYIVTGAGLHVRGYQATNGVVTASVADLQVSRAPLAPIATTNVTLDAMLAADVDTVTPPLTPLAALTLDGSATTTLATAGAASDFATSTTVYDSLGRPHDVTLLFEASGPNDWTWRAVVDGGETDLAAGVPGGAFEIASGTATFDTLGNLTAAGQTATATAWTWPGSDPFAFNLDIGGTTGTLGSIRMAGANSYTAAIAQDGRAPGTLAGLQVERDGTITGEYTNGQRQAVGQVALATFAAPEGLARLGGNLWGTSEASGDPALGAAESGGRGSAIGASLEGSNVDLEEQFVALIEMQRAYSANTGVIRTADESLQALIQLV